MGKKKLLLVLLLVILLLILLGILIWFFLNKDKATETSVTTPEQTKQATKSATGSSQKVVETPSDDELLKKAVSEKSGIDIDIIIVDVSENTGKYAKGLVTAKGETVGGGYWLAVKTNGKWVVVFDGQSTPGCDQVNPDSFPAKMVPECLDASGNIVVR